MTTEATKRHPHGSIKDVVMQAKVNDMSVPQAARHFQVNRNSIYWAARRMGVQLKVLKVRKS